MVSGPWSFSWRALCWRPHHCLHQGKHRRLSSVSTALQLMETWAGMCTCVCVHINQRRFGRIQVLKEMDPMDHRCTVQIWHMTFLVGRCVHEWEVWWCIPPFLPGHTMIREMLVRPRPMTNSTWTELLLTLSETLSVPRNLCCLTASCPFFLMDSCRNFFCLNNNPSGMTFSSQTFKESVLTWSAARMKLHYD